VVNKAFKGAEILYTLRLPTGSNLLSLFPSHHEHQVGETVGVRLAPRHLVLFRADRDA
jgi:iron(III) transport system ATP-binding protein